jgi:hypothetical protein
MCGPGDHFGAFTHTLHPYQACWKLTESNGSRPDSKFLARDLEWQGLRRCRASGSMSGGQTPQEAGWEEGPTRGGEVSVFSPKLVEESAHEGRLSSIHVTQHYQVQGGSSLQGRCILLLCLPTFRHQASLHHVLRQRSPATRDQVWGKNNRVHCEYVSTL